jgi:hypothetical protein
MSVRLLIVAAAVSTALNFVAAAAQAQTRGCQTVQTTGIKGEVKKRSPVLGEVNPLKIGECVPDGNILNTGRASIAKLRLATSNEAGTVSVGPESTVLVGFPIGGHPTKLILTRGQIRITSSARSQGDAVRLHLLRMTVIPKVKGTVVQAQTWRNDEEAWIVVVHGSAEVRLGNQTPGITLATGQSVYVTTEQHALPHVVGLDSKEQAALSQDRDFEHSIADLMTIEITPQQLQKQQATTAAPLMTEEKMSTHFDPSPRAGQHMTLDTSMDMKEEEDVTLDSLSPSAATSISPPAKNAPKAPAPPAPVFQPKPVIVPTIGNESPDSEPTSVSISKAHSSPAAPVSAPVSASVQTPGASETYPATESYGEPVVATESYAPKPYSLWSARLDFGPAFYSDAAGIDVSGAAIYSYGKFSLGGGAGYSSASKNQLTVHNWKLFALANYPYSLSKAISMTPELQLGAASESVQDATTVFASGPALYVSGRILFEAQIERSPKLHPGIALGFQDYAGGAGLSSAVLAISLRYDY